MTTSDQPEQSKWLSDLNAVFRYYGNRQIQLEFLARTKGDAQRVRDILNSAYQTGRAELTQELAALAAEPENTPQQTYGTLKWTPESWREKFGDMRGFPWMRPNEPIPAAFSPENVDNPNEKNDDGTYVLTGDQLRQWWRWKEAQLDAEDAQEARDHQLYHDSQ